MKNHAVQPPATLAQRVAFQFVYDRLVRALLLTSLGLPLCAMGFWFLNAVTGGQGIMISLFIPLYYHSLVNLLRQLSPSPEAFERSMSENGEIRLLVLSLVITSVSMSILVPIMRFFGFSIAWFPGIWSTLGWGAKCFVATLLVWTSILARYVGPQSVMRCSIFPLLSNPLEAVFTAFSNHGLMAFVEQGETPGEFRWRSQPGQRGRRLRTPTLSPILGQTLVSILAGMALAFTCVFPWFDNYDSYARFASVITCQGCFIAPIVPLVLSDQHEINPRRSVDPFICTVTVVLSTIFVPGVVFLITDLAVDYGFVHEQYSSVWVPMMICATILSLVLLLADEALKLYLVCSSPQFFDLSVDVVLQTMFSNSPVTPRILSSRPEGETIELKSTQQLAKDFGVFLISRIENYVEAPLEEDILRLNILESMGGGGFLVEGMRKRHERALQAFLPGKYEDTSAFFLLVRGLCIFVAGLGDALISASEKPKGNGGLHETWHLPPGFISASHYSITALARCFSLSPNPIDKLYFLVTPAVQALHTFRAAIFRFFELRESWSEQDRQRLAAFPGAASLPSLCDQAATVILAQRLRSLDEIKLLELSREAKIWLQRS